MEKDLRKNHASVLESHKALQTKEADLMAQHRQHEEFIKRVCVYKSTQPLGTTPPRINREKLKYPLKFVSTASKEELLEDFKKISDEAIIVPEGPDAAIHVILPLLPGGEDHQSSSQSSDLKTASEEYPGIHLTPGPHMPRSISMPELDCENQNKENVISSERRKKVQRSGQTLSTKGTKSSSKQKRVLGEANITIK